MPECPNCGHELSRDARECPECATPAPTPTESFEAVGGAERVALEPRERPEGPALFVSKGPEVGDTFYIDRPSLTVGRDPDSDIFLNDVTVSRTHAVLEMDAEGVTVRDVGSLNGTYVNGQCVDSAVLADGDVVQVGAFRMVFVGLQGDEE